MFPLCMATKNEKGKNFCCESLKFGDDKKKNIFVYWMDFS